MVKVFLGGTCNGSIWREKLIPKLECDYFNPVVENWDAKAQAQEIVERANADYCLFVITPQMKGVYSIAEVVDDSNKKPDSTIFCVLAGHCWYGNYTDAESYSLDAVKKLVVANGAQVFDTLDEIADFLNSKHKGE